MIGRLRNNASVGYHWLTTTPKGKNWLWQKFVQPQHTDKKEWGIYTFKTEDNPYLNPEYAAGLRKEYHGDFAAQELDAVFVDYAGIVYNEFDSERHVLANPPVRGLFRKVIAGVDWGYANPGCIVVVGIDGDGGAVVVDEIYQDSTTIADWARMAADIAMKWGIEMFYCDPSDPTAIRQFNEMPGVRAQRAVTDVKPGINQIKNRLANPRTRLYIARQCTNVIREMQLYARKTENDGTITEDVQKANDHAMDALRYALYSDIDHRMSSVARVSMVA